MKILYIPKRDSNDALIPGREVGFAVLTPDVPRSKYIFEMAIHGVGERSNGRQEHLENLVLGQKQPDGSRKWPFVTDEMKKAIDEYGLIMAIPTYETNTFFEPSQINYVYDYIKANYPIYDKMLLTGFSLGAGAVIKYITSAIANASRVGYAVLCAATNNILDKTIPGKVNLPVHAYSNDNDPTVNVSNTRTIVTRLNEINPGLKALMTIFDKDGHGSNDEAWSRTPPKAPGGEGFTDAAENTYQVITDIIKNGPRQMKAGAVIPPTPEEPPATTLTAVAGVLINGIIEVVDELIIVNDTINFDGTKSTGYESASWTIVSAPEGVNLYHPIIVSGGGWITSVAKFPKEGLYRVRLRTKQGTSIREDFINVTYTKTGTPPEKQLLQKVFIPRNNNYVYVYDDGSVETKSE
jgi:hypothetical protein